MKQSLNNKKHFLKNAIARHCACDIQNFKSRAWRNKYKSRNVSFNTRRNLLNVVLHKDFSSIIWHKINKTKNSPAMNENYI